MLYADGDEVNDSGYHRDYKSIMLLRWCLNITLLIYFDRTSHFRYETRREVRAEKCVFGGLCEPSGRC